MKQSIYNRNIRRTIKGSFGRFMAILAIIALGVGFFVGVKNTEQSMLVTCDKYVTDHTMYDFKLLSTYGFEQEDEAVIAENPEVQSAEGAYSSDFFSEDMAGNSVIVRAHSITEKVNTVSVTEGRMPEKEDECLADGHFYGKRDIGTTVKVTAENDKESKDALTYDEYEIVGIASTPLYMMKTERGTTSLGDGKINAYILIEDGGFDMEYFTEMYVRTKDEGFVYSDEYEDYIADAEESITADAESRSGERFEKIVSDAREEIDDGQRELDDGRAELERERDDVYGQLASAKQKLDDGSAEIKDGKAQIKDKRKELRAAKDEVSSQKEALDDALEAARHPQSGVPQEQIAQMEAQQEALEGALDDIEDGLIQISSKEVFLAKKQREIDSGYGEYRTNLARADREFASAEAELKEGEEELEEARKDLEELEEPELFVQDRMDNIGYSSFESNAAIVDGVAKVFPVFFFLIAALVCSTTMTRMIEEERTQIGALRALGYTRGQVMKKYMVYSGSAAIIGCAGGFLAGSKYFPYAIWTAYGMMFGFSPIEFYFDPVLAVASLAVALICSIGTTWFACRGQLSNTPAEIMRPKSPKAGKRIILEKIGFVWKRMRFLYKVSARNIFRYKKRMIMMILGIGGCTALVMAGFGINDSIAGIADHQYTEIEKYTLTAGFSEEVDEERADEIADRYSDEITNIAVLQRASVNVAGDGLTKSCSLMITGDEDIEKAVNFSFEGEKKKYPGQGEALITNRLAEVLDLEEGDTIEIEYDDTERTELVISGIYKNYVNNYIYINDGTYEEYFHKDYEPALAFVTVGGGHDSSEVSEDLYEEEDIAGVSVNDDIRQRVDDMMVSLNYIIILVIGCAGALAFIVLFNLGNINITERVREIATIEVLGFYPRETASYVFRENFILVLLGILAGIPAGFVFHRFIMAQIDVDMVSFNEVIEPQSYLFTVLVVIGFSFVVDVIMRRKLRKINMAEALKSIE